jgi:hypothetical protein
MWSRKNADTPEHINNQLKNALKHQRPSFRRTPDIQDVDESIAINSWTPACTGNCSCVSNTSAIHGGRAGVTKLSSKTC